MILWKSHEKEDYGSSKFQCTLVLLNSQSPDRTQKKKKKKMRKNTNLLSFIVLCKECYKAHNHLFVSCVLLLVDFLVLFLFCYVVEKKE